ncbi:MAG TPA: helix-turn-helix domain-containing protein [Burkholderiaceae bacterium]
MKTIVILALDGMLESTLAITRDTFATGATLLARKQQRVRIVTAAYRKTVKTAGGMTLQADLPLRDVAALRPDWIVVPGAGLLDEAAIAARLTGRDVQAALRLLNTLAEDGTQLAASCSSVFLLAEAGLLAGRHATMTWWLAPIFRTRHPEVTLDETRMLVRDGPCLTAGAAFAQLDLALAVVADTMGAQVAQLCARYLLIDERASQARYMLPTHLRDTDPTVVAAERWIDRHLEQPISIAELSSALSVTPKTLSRRLSAALGVTPVKFIQRRRLLRASHLLETTALSVDAIAAKVGYQDGTALRKLVKREFGATPRALR